MLTYRDLEHKLPEGWWKDFDWKVESFFIVTYYPKLLLTVPRWWEYYNWIPYTSFVLIEQVPNILTTVPQWWEYYKWDSPLYIEELPYISLVIQHINWRWAC